VLFLFPVSCFLLFIVSSLFASYPVFRFLLLEININKLQKKQKIHIKKYKCWWTSIKRKKIKGKKQEQSLYYSKIRKISPEPLRFNYELRRKNSLLGSEVFSLCNIRHVAAKFRRDSHVSSDDRRDSLRALLTLSIALSVLSIPPSEQYNMSSPTELRGRDRLSHCITKSHQLTRLAYTYIREFDGRDERRNCKWEISAIFTEFQL